MARILVSVSSPTAEIVKFRVKLSEYPNLKILHQDTPILVVGRIAQVDTLAITLDSVTLTIK